MAKASNFTQGGDAQAISQVVNSHYGSFRNMFKSHGWDVSGDKMMTSAPKLIVEEYGSIKRFEELHAPGDFMSPLKAIYSDPPNVWLTSFYGFRPEAWGFLGFADKGRRQGFLDKTKPGALVVIYGAGKASRDELGKVLGIVQCSHQIGTAEEFISPEEWIKKERDPETKKRWNEAVKVTRAWRVTPETRMEIRKFAPIATANDAWEHIGSRGVPLDRTEAMRIFKLNLQEVEVYGESHIDASAVGSALQILAPSKAGPVSQSSYIVKEAEGPKHLYILKLVGDTDNFLGESSNGNFIIKPGFSKSPLTRCSDFNKALPNSSSSTAKYRWEVLYSGPSLSLDAYPTSDHAKAGEKAIQKAILKNTGRSLGNEFFLADVETIELAWLEGNAAAKDF